MPSRDWDWRRSVFLRLHKFGYSVWTQFKTAWLKSNLSSRVYPTFTIFLSTVHKFSIGLRSGFWLGQSIKFILTLLKYSLTFLAVCCNLISLTESLKLIQKLSQFCSFHSQISSKINYLQTNDSNYQVLEQKMSYERGDYSNLNTK